MDPRVGDAIRRMCAGWRCTFKPHKIWHILRRGTTGRIPSCQHRMLSWSSVDVRTCSSYEDGFRHAGNPRIPVRTSLIKERMNTDWSTYLCRDPGGDPATLVMLQFSRCKHNIGDIPDPIEVKACKVIEGHRLGRVRMK